MDRVAYISEMKRILSDTDTYLPLPHDPTVRYNRELQKLIEKGFNEQLINKKEKAFLVPMAPRIPVIYFLPKIHKSLVNPPGRPIISGLESVTSRIGKYIDAFLQPLVSQTPSFLRDSSQVLQILDTLVWKEG